MSTVLPFHDLAARHRGLSHGTGTSYTEAARICLDRHHVSPIDMTISDTASMVVKAEWEACDVRLQGAWANEIDATEAGAYGLSLAAVEVGRGMLAIRRAETRTGADYYIALADTPLDDLEGWFRLEVSGVDRGDENTIRGRLREKIRQTQAGDSNLPALATVVGFKARLIMVADVVSV